MKAASVKPRWINNVGRRLTMKPGRLPPIAMRQELIWLKRWASNLGRAEIYADDRYDHFKIPVSTAFASLATRLPNLERQVLKTLLCGAENLRQNPALIAHPDARIAVLASVKPDYFASEVTIFFDTDYYQSFCHDPVHLGGAVNPLQRHNLKLPNGFAAWGTRYSYDAEWSCHPITEERWTFGEKI